MAERADTRKLTHESVNYGRGTAASQCSICKRYIEPKFSYATEAPRCEIVQSPIGPRMWCDRFERR